MDSREHLGFLRERGLLTRTKRSVPALKKVIKECLEPRNGELLVITDKGEPGRETAGVLGAGYYLAAREMGLKPVILSQKPKSSLDIAEPHVKDGLENIDDGHMVVFSLSNKLGEIKDIAKSLRGLMHERQCKYISSTSLGTVPNNRFQAVLDSMDIDYGELRKQQAILKSVLDRGKEIRIKTKAGTDFVMDIGGKESVSNDGNYTIPGRGGNIPCGEVYIPPCGKEGVDGKIVIDVSSRSMSGTMLLKEPINLEVGKGRVTCIEGGMGAKLLEDSLMDAENRARRPDNIRLISELGIGCNPRARVVGAMMVDEKVKGTAHVAIGSNAWFGGDIKTIVHLDQVLSRPKITVDGKPLKH